MHATDDRLDQYSMGHLVEPELAEFEEHLLICPKCQDAVALTDDYCIGVKRAARELRRPIPAAARHWFRQPKPLWALGVAALCLLVFNWPLFHRASTPPALVVLESTRGPDALNSSTAAGKPFTLSPDLTGLPPLPQYNLEIVDASGRRVFWSTRLRATLRQGLPAGMYYVRLYAPGQELLREYGLRVAN